MAKLGQKMGRKAALDFAIFHFNLLLTLAAFYDEAFIPVSLEK